MSGVERRVRERHRFGAPRHGNGRPCNACDRPITTFGQSDRGHRADRGAQLCLKSCARTARRGLFRIQILKEDGGIGLLNIEEGGSAFQSPCPSLCKAGRSVQEARASLLEQHDALRGRQDSHADVPSQVEAAGSQQGLKATFGMPGERWFVEVGVRDSESVQRLSCNGDGRHVG
jgi:hypothetical protein